MALQEAQKKAKTLMFYLQPSIAKAFISEKLFFPSSDMPFFYSRVLFVNIIGNSFFFSFGFFFYLKNVYYSHSLFLFVIPVDAYKKAVWNRCAQP